MKSIDGNALRQILEYDPSTGNLIWLARPLSMFASEGSAKSWNAKFSGTRAFTYVSRDGYYQGSIFNRLHLAHRVIWAMQTGQWPTSEIDHADCNGCNNEWSNLRLATRSENTCNTRRRSDNTSGIKGLSWDQRRQKWKARIYLQDKEISLGRFASFEQAKCTLTEARLALHGKFARL